MIMESSHHQNLIRMAETSLGELCWKRKGFKKTFIKLFEEYEDFEYLNFIPDSWRILSNPKEIHFIEVGDITPRKILMLSMFWFMFDMDYPDWGVKAFHIDKTSLQINELNLVNYYYSSLFQGASNGKNNEETI